MTKSLIVIFFSLLLIFGCGGEKTALIYYNKIPEFTSIPDMARVVVLRIDKFHDPANLYIDSNFVTQTLGKTIVSFAVTPGVHHIIGSTWYKKSVRMDFKPGRVYYLAYLLIWQGLAARGNRVFPLTQKEAFESISTSEVAYQYAEYDNNVSSDDINGEEVGAEEFRKELKDHEEWARENPVDARLEREYEGY